MSDGASEHAQELATRLCGLLPSLDAAARAAVARRVSAAAGGEGAARLAAASKRPGAGAADPDALARAMAIVLEQVGPLEGFAWSTWRQLAPDSPVRRGADVVTAAGEMLFDDAAGGAAGAAAGGASGGATGVASGGEAGGGGEAALVEALARFRQLVAAMLAAVANAGEAAFEQMAPLSPMQIERFARAEKKWNESLDFACWRKYRELASRLDQASVEDSLRAAIAARAEELISPR